MCEPYGASTSREWRQCLSFHSQALLSGSAGSEGAGRASGCTERVMNGQLPCKGGQGPLIEGLVNCGKEEVCSADGWPEESSPRSGHLGERFPVMFLGLDPAGLVTLMGSEYKVYSSM